ncbi:MAG TPA: flagellar export protein FliJ [Bauldia sp.]|nr:flagellar export protein FliJ [Bauldia sp.]
MKSREGVIRLKRFHAEEKRRKVAQIEQMIAEFDRMAKDLSDQIAAEETRSGIHDINHFAYPTLAKAAMQRRDNLVNSANGMRSQLEEARAELAAAVEELEKIQALADRDHGHDRGGETSSAPRGAAMYAR